MFSKIFTAGASVFLYPHWAAGVGAKRNVSTQKHPPYKRLRTGWCPVVSEPRAGCRHSLVLSPSAINAYSVGWGNSVQPRVNGVSGWLHSRWGEAISSRTREAAQQARGSISTVIYAPAGQREPEVRAITCESINGTSALIPARQGSRFGPSSHPIRRRLNAAEPSPTRRERFVHPGRGSSRGHRGGGRP